MTVRVDLDELLDASDWVTAGESASLNAQAYVSRKLGRIHWGGEGVEDDLPEDADDETAYAAVPVQSELGLGRSLALGFVAGRLPELLEEARACFRSRGAYSRFKAMLDSAGQVEQWYLYEQAAKEASLTRWCVENGFLASRGGADVRGNGDQ